MFRVMWMRFTGVNVRETNLDFCQIRAERNFNHTELARATVGTHPSQPRALPHRETSGSSKISFRFGSHTIDDAYLGESRMVIQLNHPAIGSVYKCIFAVTMGFSSLSVAAKDVVITPETDPESVAENLVAGDSLVLSNGTWKDADLKFEGLSGTAEKPIRIRAETAGQVVFTGQTEFRFSGSHVIVTGFVFRDITEVSDVVQFRTHSQRHAHDCRMSDCVFEQTPDSEAGIESRWVSVYGTHNRIDHCYFGGKRSRGTTVVVWVRDEVEGHRIDHNHFGPRPELGKNGGETIRIGTSDVSELTSGTIVEDNFFYRCDGEAEIISNKSCDNIYRHNVFEECSGTLTLRHGHQCRVDGNVFLGKTQRGTGGVRIIGRDHVVVNNYFEGLRGDAERAAICMMNGIPNGSLDGYAPVSNAVVSHNTFVDCKVSLELGVGAGKKQSANPADCRVTHNAFLPGKWALFRIHSTPIRFVWEGNKQEPRGNDQDQPVQFERIDLRLERASDGLLRPVQADSIRTSFKSTVASDIDGHPRGDVSLAGCDDPHTPRREQPSASNTGPTWQADKPERNGNVD